ncbi:hypothetical protein AB0M43_08220 [Longispora sp. NPDC051575]|uniref:hypothetical protein n=1 Tax=Longispora sp. NPDC051575 TaxID=3154943 RepID=UPI00341541A4
MRRALSVLLAVVLIGGVVTAVLLGRDSDEAPGATTVHGVIGSEKLPFFADPDVVVAFAKHGLTVKVDPLGSREMAARDPKTYDFAFPSSAPTAERIERQLGTGRHYTPFSSPMAVATFAPVAELLASRKLAAKDPAGHWTLDMKAYLAAARDGLRWGDIPNSAAVALPSRHVLVTTTAPRASNSAAMYAAVAGYLANNDRVLGDEAQAKAVLDRVGPLFRDQGYLETSSGYPFESYLSQGMGYSPMVWIYEAQYVGAKVKPEMALMYPSPTILSQHTVVPRTDGGDKVGNLLVNDPELRKLAARHGFRTPDTGAALPALTQTVPPPSYDVLEALLDALQH